MLRFLAGAKELDGSIPGVPSGLPVAGRASGQEMFKVHARRRSDMEKSRVFEARFRRLCVYCQEKVPRSNQRGNDEAPSPHSPFSPARAYLPAPVFLCLLSGGLL